MSSEVSEMTLEELKRECETECTDGDCGDCCIMEEINKLKSEEIRKMDDEELEKECNKCIKPYCRESCIVQRELDWRRQIRSGRDVAHEGSIIEGGGVSQPEWMDDDQYAEYKVTSEYAHEVSYQGFGESDDMEDRYYD